MPCPGKLRSSLSLSLALSLSLLLPALERPVSLSLSLSQQTLEQARKLPIAQHSRYQSKQINGDVWHEREAGSEILRSRLSLILELLKNQTCPTKVKRFVQILAISPKQLLGILPKGLQGNIMSARAEPKNLGISSGPLLYVVSWLPFQKGISWTSISASLGTLLIAIATCQPQCWGIWGLSRLSKGMCPHLCRQMFLHIDEQKALCRGPDRSGFRPSCFAKRTRICWPPESVDIDWKTMSPALVTCCYRTSVLTTE